MNPKISYVHYDDDLRTIAKKMLQEKAPSFQVMKDGVVVGTVSYEHILRAFVNLLDHPEKHSLGKNVQEFFYVKPVGEIINTLAQVGL